MKNRPPMNIDYMAALKPMAALSIALMIASIILIATRGLSLGMDFTGGTTVIVESQHAIDIDAVRETVASAGFDEAVVQHYGSSNDVSIRVPPQSHLDTNKIGKMVFDGLRQHNDELKLLQVNFIGPQVGDELRDQSGLAVLVSAILMAIYVWFRFTNKFGIATVFALIHDVVLIIGLFSLMRWQFDLTVLAGVLALIGYSLNDTVVIADRIRENFKFSRETNVRTLINQSINETMSRTIITSLTTILTLTALLALGGEVVRGFSLALLIGIVIATYSSIYMMPLCLFVLKISKDDFMVTTKQEIDEQP